jgi:hypothetical protein
MSDPSASPLGEIAKQSVNRTLRRLVSGRDNKTTNYAAEGYLQ